MAIEAPRSLLDAASLLLHGTNLPLFLPFLLGFSASAPSLDQTCSGPGSGSRPWPDQFVFIDPFTRSLVVVGTVGPDGAPGAEGGLPPVLRASVVAMPGVEVEEGRKGECVVCLESVAAGEPTKEMTCRHRFLGGCVEQWLGIHGTCPVCRYEMPVEEGGAGEKRRGGAWVSFAFGVGGGDGDDRVSSSSSSS